MDWARFPNAVHRGTSAYLKRTGVTGALSFGLLFLLAFVVVEGVVENYRFDHLSAAVHLQLAMSACGLKTISDSVTCISPSEAKRQLTAIPSGTKEYLPMTVLLTAIDRQEEQQAADRAKSSTETRDREFARYQANVSGSAHDPFTCSISTDKKPIMSFDREVNWWYDDGRCQLQQQKIRDSTAEVSSYWSTTFRVNTDMDSSWLPDEERVCQTYPDEKGKVSIVACNPTDSHRDHNIPVKFWGGTERNTVSRWKCRREKNLLDDNFVCRALD